MTNYLETEKTSKLLLKFSIPCVLSLLISALYNIVDQIFIGNSNVGAIGNTATTIVFPLTCIALAFGLLLGDGTAAYMSICQGRKEYGKITKAGVSAIVIAVIISILSLVICFPLLENILSFFGAKTEESLKYSKEYAIVILIGFPFYIIMNMLNSIIRADGSPKVAMISMVLGAVINVILDAVFIFPCNMGLTGAALATIIGQIASFVVSVIYFIKPKSFKFTREDIGLSISELKNILRLGFSSFLTQISIVIISVVSMNMLAKYGAQSKYGANDPQAIVGVVMKVFTIVINIAVGIAAGGQPIVGYNYGAGRMDRVKQLFRQIIIANIILGVIATLIFQFFPQAVIKMFGSTSKNPELYIEFGVLAVRIYLMLILFTVIQKVSSIFLQSIGSPVKATILSLVRDVITFVPLTLILPIFMGIEGVLWSAPIADSIAIIITIILLILEFKRNKNNGLEK